MRKQRLRERRKLPETDFKAQIVCSSALLPLPTLNPQRSPWTPKARPRTFRVVLAADIPAVHIAGLSCPTVLQRALVYTDISLPLESGFPKL